MTTIDARELRNAFGSFMTGVTVVTAISDSGEKVGFTANSFTSVSVQPPLLLVCPSEKLSSFEVFNHCKYFAVNILAENQQDISNTFAGASGDRFEGINWHDDDNGCPIIDDTVAHFSCSTYSNTLAGDHILLVGQVNDFACCEKRALGYAKGGYFSLGMEHRAEELTHSFDGIVGAIIQHHDKVLLTATKQGYTLPYVATRANQGSQKTICQFLDDQGLDCEVGSVYSLYENVDAQTFSTFYHANSSNGLTAELGEYIAIDQLADINFSSSDIQSMLQRFVHEKQNGVFHLYVGDNKSGDIH